MRRKVVSSCSGEGAGVNAESSVKLKLAYAAADPLSELVWSPHTGLTVKCTNPDLRKPLLLWNVGAGPAGDDHHIITDQSRKEVAAAAGTNGDSAAQSSKRKICDDENLVCFKVDESSEGGKKIGAKTSNTSLWITRLSTNTLKGKETAEDVTKPGLEDVLLKKKKKKKKRRRELINQSLREEMMFDAIRKLRLSRADIVRWMDSEAPLSHLKGFFVRLRVGPTCYCVGCITGDDTSRNRKCISVDVGGIKSSVATQYVSNHHFQQDEMKAWWSRTVRSGCTIPSLADLNSKFNHRPTFGF